MRFKAQQLHGVCRIQGQPWEVAPYRRVIRTFLGRASVVEDTERQVVALCSRPQWEDVRYRVRRFK